MDKVRLAMRIAVAILLGLSSMMTISAASIAASLPRAPIAIPMSALARTGASLMPSPTNARYLRFPCAVPWLLPDCSDCFFRSSSTILTLSAGISSEWYSPMPSFSAIWLATSLRSPVSITVCPTPRSSKDFIACALSSFIWSLMTMCPAYLPSMATWIIVPEWLHLCHLTPIESISFSLPTCTVYVVPHSADPVPVAQSGIPSPSAFCPADPVFVTLAPASFAEGVGTDTFSLFLSGSVIVALAPLPAISSTAETLHPSVASAGKASLKALAIGWVEKCST